MKSLKQKLTTAFLGASLLGIIGCEKQQTLELEPFNNLKYQRDSYNQHKRELKEISDEAIFKGKIVKVQPSHFSYYLGYKGFSTVYLVDSSVSDSHEFIYVIGEDNNKGLHTLIYPQSEAILEREAEIKYEPLKLGGLTTREFTKAFITNSFNKQYYEIIVNNNLFLKAEGIILPDGIRYIQDGKK